ncbi:MAG: hypothetical protein IPL71_21715 [Anaerolineales bacterium]|uniref:hypothetical protein n=1 Tax=Candidatus Villigracilis proximus TaxID=3140683 RepID=UPI003137478B|nr:hypothetical protein [Anaerolineales bacterium]
MREIYKSKMQGSVDRRRNIPDDILLEIEIPIPAKNIMDEILRQHKEIEKAKRKAKDLNLEMQNTIETLWG